MDNERFDTILEALLYYYPWMSVNESRHVDISVHGVDLGFDLYKLPVDFTITQENISTLFPLLTADDGPTQVLMCGNLFIENDVVCSPPRRCKGLIILCKNELFNAGTISMTSRGASAKGDDLYLLDQEFVPAVGASGGAAFYIPNNTVRAGSPGNNGINRQSGGGGSGGGRNWNKTVRVGKGGNGTSYSGGVGSGGAQEDGYYGGNVSSADASNTGGAGGAPALSGGNQSGLSIIALGGNGNPPNLSSRGYRASAGTVWGDSYGTGGLIVIYANSVVNNIIQSDGCNAVTCSGSAGYVATGGATGGGSINIFYSDLLIEGTITANGGTRTAGGRVNVWGGTGGNGCITLTQTDALFVKRRRNTNFYKNVSLQEGFDYERIFT